MHRGNGWLPKSFHLGRAAVCLPRGTPSRALSAPAVEAIPQHALVKATVAPGGLAGLHSCVPERPPHLDVSLEEPGLVIVDVVLLADGLHQLPRFAKVVPGKSGKEMVLDLELQTDVHPVKPLRRGNVHGRPQLHEVPLGLLRRVGGALVGLHGPVGEHDLDVQDARHGVGDHDPADRQRPGRHGEGQGEHPREERANTNELGLPVEGPVMQRDQVDEALHVQVPPPQRHQGVEINVLVRHQESGDPIHADNLFVIRVPERLLENLARDCQHRHVLDVRIVLDGVTHDVVGVVVRLPPAERKAHQAREERTDLVVEVKVVGDA
mmetsp:Transcript_40761/g.106121  ORF Transcript_40761/g.106121 Transcript_40761/m.106121 type:complete len:323 (+) Transcript_40761:62-1030(+)